MKALFVIASALAIFFGYMQWYGLVLLLGALVFGAALIWALIIRGREEAHRMDNFVAQMRAERHQ